MISKISLRELDSEYEYNKVRCLLFLAIELLDLSISSSSPSHKSLEFQNRRLILLWLQND